LSGPHARWARGFTLYWGRRAVRGLGTWSRPTQAAGQLDELAHSAPPDVPRPAAPGRFFG